MMLASVPVVPAATRSAEPDLRSAKDCCERLDRLEENVSQLAEAMRELQTLVHDQSRALQAITEELKSKPE